AAEQHRRALREQQRRQHVALLTFSKGDDVLVVGRPLGAAIPGMVVGAAVAIAFAVGVVVLVVVARPVVQGETVMRRDEIDAGPAPPAVAVEDIAGAEHARRERCGMRLAAPEVAYGVAELVVPLGPARRKAADLIAAGAGVPGLGNQFHGGQAWVLVHRFQKA